MTITRDYVRAMYKLNQEIEQKKKELEAMKATVKATAEAEGVNGYQWSEIGIQLVNSTRSTFDKKRFEQDYPGMVDGYMKKTDVVSLRFK